MTDKINTALSQFCEEPVHPDSAATFQDLLKSQGLVIVPRDPTVEMKKSVKITDGIMHPIMAKAVYQIMVHAYEEEQ